MGIVRDWQIFGHGSDFPTWSEVGTNYEAKPPNFEGNFEPSYLMYIHPIQFCAVALYDVITLSYV